MSVTVPDVQKAIGPPSRARSQARPTRSPHKSAPPKKASKSKPKGGRPSTAKRKPKPKKPPPNSLAAVTIKGRQGEGQLTGGQWVKLQAKTRQTEINCRLGPSGARITGGYGNWEEVKVPRWHPLTQWTGRSLWTMDIDLLLDRWGWVTRKDSFGWQIEFMIDRIELLALLPGKGTKPRGRPLYTPPPIRIFGPVPHPELTWVIEGIDWGDALRDPVTGRRVRQALTLHLMEYREEAEISSLRGAAEPRSAPRKYKTKKGDNLKTIASKMLGKSSRWTEIEKLNKGLRGWQIPKKMIGKTILVPAW